jgi:uncharacterized protein (TIGR00369 family)
LVALVTERSGIDILRNVAEGRAAMPPAAALLGWQALEIRPGHVRVRYEAREAFYNPQGVVQGGLLAAMLDDAMGPAAFTLLNEGTFAPTLEMKVSFVRPARAGPLIAEGNVVHQSRRFIHAEGRLTTEDGQLIATATATLVVSQQKEEP